MKKILYALFLTFLLNACMQYYRVVKTEGTGIKGYSSKSSDVYLTEPYKGNPEQGGRIYVRIRKTEKNILAILIEREDIKDGSRYYWDSNFNKTFMLLDTPIITDNNGNKLTILKTNINPNGNLKKGIYGRSVDIYLEKDVPEEFTIDLGKVKIKDEIYNTGKIYLKRE